MPLGIHVLANMQLWNFLFGYLINEGYRGSTVDRLINLQETIYYFAFEKLKNTDLKLEALGLQQQNSYISWCRINN